MSDKPAIHFDTACVRAGEVDLGTETPPLAPPIFQASVFETPTLDLAGRALSGEPGLYSYSRDANPTVAAFERAVADLEGGQEAVAAASGMGAISATLLSLLRHGDCLVTTPALYGTTLRLIDTYLVDFGIEVFHISEGELESALPEGTKMLYTETISNPLLGVADLHRLADLAHRAGALLVVDSTFATPYHCRPLEHSADVVIHSATKYFGGHADLTAGVAVGRADIAAGIRQVVQQFGAPAGVLDAWLALRGLRTLQLRMERHARNAQEVAKWLQTHPKIESVYYPGLASHPTHEVARRVLRFGFGGMVAFEMARGGDAVSGFLSGLRTTRFAASLGDVSTTVSHPSTTSHRRLTREQRGALGIGDGLVRLSVGIEAVADITADLEVGLAAA